MLANEDVHAGHDLWWTPEFLGGPELAPFGLEGVRIKGEPIGEYLGIPTDITDTIVQRLSDVPQAGGTTNIILRRLSLRTEVIDNGCGSGRPGEYLIREDPARVSGGVMGINHSAGAGDGDWQTSVFDVYFQVQPVIPGTNTPCLSPLSAGPLDLTMQSPARWEHIPTLGQKEYPQLTSNFFVYASPIPGGPGGGLTHMGPHPVLPSPEPGTLALLAVGGLAAVRRRR